MTIAQNMPPEDVCLGIGMLIVATAFAGCSYAAYQYGYRKGRQSALDDKHHGFPVLPPAASEKPPVSGQKT
jgi:hypothetical protein